MNYSCSAEEGVSPFITQPLIVESQSRRLDFSFSWHDYASPPAGCKELTFQKQK